MSEPAFLILWDDLDILHGPRPWLTDSGEVLTFESRSEARAFMDQLYANPDFRKLVFTLCEK